MIVTLLRLLHMRILVLFCYDGYLYLASVTSHVLLHDVAICYISFSQCIKF